MGGLPVLRIGVVALAVTMMVAPPATAQEPMGPVEITFAVPGDEEIEVLAPETGLVQVPITIVFSIPPGHVCTKNLAASFEVSGPAYATPVVLPAGRTWTIQEDPTVFSSNGGVNETVDVKLFVSTTREAPAMTAGEYTIWANLTAPATEPDCTVQDASSSTSFRITNGFFPLIDALAHQTSLKVAPGDAFRFALDVTNFGNGETIVTGAVDSAHEALSFADLDPVTLGSEHKDTKHETTSATVFIEGTAKGDGVYTNSVLGFHALFAGKYGGPEAAVPPGASDQQTLSLSVQITGAQAPASGAFFVVFALAVGAALTRRRRP